MNSSLERRKLSRARKMLARGDTAAAAELLEHLLQLGNSSSELLSLHSQVCQRQGRLTDMLRSAQAAQAQDETDFELSLRLAECLLLTANSRQALELSKQLEPLAAGNPTQLQQLAAFYTHSGQHEAAHACYHLCLEQQSESAGLLYNAAAAATAVGQLEQAEQLYDRVLQLHPDDHDAWYNRSTLRKQTAARNHVKALQFMHRELDPRHPGQTPVCYALAKEFEDLGRYEEAFSALQQGASVRRARLQYDVADDERALQLIARHFNEDYFALPAAQQQPGPVFIVGLPRSGTTLLEQMVCSHSQVDSLGEINTLALAITGAVGKHKGREDLIEQAARQDVNDLAQRYLQGSRGLGQGAACLVDKTPLNFLYIGLLRRALPGAKVLHMRRHPVDSCYAVYKTLFRMGYPFSYSLQDMGRYYMAYHALMGHWRRHIGDFFLDVDYEKLVSQPEPELRRVFEFIGLEWDPASLDFGSSERPVATASAAQVRQPLYQTSVQRWKCYARQLGPLARKLQNSGIPID